MSWAGALSDTDRNDFIGRLISAGREQEIDDINLEL